MEEEELFDSESGEILQQVLVQTARKEELDFMEKFGIYEDATTKVCFAETGRAPVVDVTKGTGENPNIHASWWPGISNRRERKRGRAFRMYAALGGKEGALQHRTHEKEFREGR